MTVTRRISVISTTVVKTGVSTSGSPWTLYEVIATDEHGAPIEEKLKSFEKLEGTVEVEVERQEHPKYGVSFTLKPVAAGAAEAPSPGARLGPKVDELRDRIATLERRLAETNSVVTTLVERANAAPPSPGDSPSPLPAPAPAREPQPEPEGGATF
jgi:hypothetical protein